MKAAELFDLSGHVAVVTGAASGLGLAIAQVIAANGGRVAMLDIDEGKLKQAAAAIDEAGGAVETFSVDIAEAGKVESVVDAYAERYGRLDCVFANAGASGGPGCAPAVGRSAESSSLPTWYWPCFLVLSLKMKGRSRTEVRREVIASTDRFSQLRARAAAAAPGSPRRSCRRGGRPGGAGRSPAGALPARAAHSPS